MLSVFVLEPPEGKGKNREERCAFVATAAAGGERKATRKFNRKV